MASHPDTDSFQPAVRSGYRRLMRATQVCRAPERGSLHRGRLPYASVHPDRHPHGLGDPLSDPVRDVLPALLSSRSRCLAGRLNAFFRDPNRAAKSENVVRSEWTYAILGIIDTEARFTLGTRWIQAKSQYPEAIDQLTPIVSDYVDVEALYTDRELISGALLDEFRAIAGSDWVTKAPERKTITDINKATPSTTLATSQKLAEIRQRNQP